MTSTEETIDMMRNRLEENHRYNWRRAARNLLLIVFLWLFCALAIYGLYALVMAGIEAIKK